MSADRILVFSSSRTGNSGYLETALPAIKNFLGESVLKIAFIPFASVDNDYHAYNAIVKKALASLGHVPEPVTPGNARSVIENTDLIMTGGGNTFKLLHDLYQLDLLDIIRDKINSGAPYIGWSAGSNITGPTICTTNDMPVIEPKSFKALALLPFQINPHYTNVKPEGHNGETRDQRLTEFVKMNPGVPVVCLPEGTALKKENGRLTFIGTVPGVLFSSGKDNAILRKEISVKEDLSFLL